MLSLKNIKIGINKENKLKEKILKTLKIKNSELLNFSVTKKSIDSRDKNNVFYVFNVNVEVKNEKRLLKLKNVSEVKEYNYEIKKINNNKKNVVIVGSGPAGLMAALILAQSGINPIIVEQGKDVDNRQKDIEKFWLEGKLDKYSNVQFGAGGAGTFSDGKLTTGVNNDRKLKFFDELIKHGAPKDIMYLSKPHLGTDNLINIVRNICKEIEDLGGKIIYSTKFIDYIEKDGVVKKAKLLNLINGEKYDVECDDLILAIGHSSRETFELLNKKGLEMKSKPFSVGFRIEHLQKDVNKCQYGKFHKDLPTASYKLNYHLDDRGVYTFCMCPGGVVVGSSSEEKKVVTNGMSYYNRDLTNSNSALLVSVGPKDFGEGPLDGIEFQRELESLAFSLGGNNYNAPVQKLGDFLKGEISSHFTKVIPSYKPGYKSVNLKKEFPNFIVNALHEGIVNLQKKVDFLNDSEAVLTAIESRSSSPLTIIRGENLMAKVKGIYPCGEGAGYAGGIVSSAIDGIRCAEKIIEGIEKNF